MNNIQRWITVSNFETLITLGVYPKEQKKPQKVLYKIYGPCLVRYHGQTDTFQLYGFNDRGDVRFLDPDNLKSIS